MKNKMATTESELSVDKRRVVITIFGAAKVGKTSIITQLLEKTFFETYKATVEDVHHGSFRIGALSNFELVIKDTSGSYEFPAMRRLAIQQSDGIVLVYSDDCRQSFQYVEKVLNEIRSEKQNFCTPILVVRNKIDNDFMPLPPQYAKQRNIVCNDWKCHFTETSAKKNIYVDTVFVKILRAIYPDIVQSNPKVQISISKVKTEKTEGRFELFKKRCTQLVRRFSGDKYEIIR